MSPLPKPDVAQIEASIRLLQGAGYTVFQTAARQTARYTHRIPVHVAAHRAGFLHHVSRDTAGKIGRLLLERQYLAFNKEPVDPEGPWAQFDFTGTLDFFPVANAEWRRW